MFDLVFVGGGPLARQWLEWMSDAEPDRIADVKGYLSVGVSDGRLSAELACLGEARDYRPGINDVFVCALLEPREKLTVCREIRARGGRFRSLRPSDSGGPRRIVVGEGCLLAPKTGLGGDIRLDAFVTVQPFAGIGHDVAIGAGATIGAHCVIGGFGVIGEGVVLQPNVVVLTGVRVGDFSRVGAGSVVVRDVPPDTAVWGVPARRVDIPVEAF